MSIDRYDYLMIGAQLNALDEEINIWAPENERYVCGFKEEEIIIVTGEGLGHTYYVGKVLASNDRWKAGGWGGNTEDGNGIAYVVDYLTLPAEINRISALLTEKFKRKFFVQLLLISAWR